MCSSPHDNVPNTHNRLKWKGRGILTSAGSNVEASAFRGRISGTLIFTSLLFLAALVGVGMASAVYPAGVVVAIALLVGSLTLPSLKFFISSVAMLIGATVDILGHFELGEISLMGVATVFVSLASWSMWLTRPRFVPNVRKVMVPWSLYVSLSLISLVLGGFSTGGFQYFLVTVGFLGLLVVSANMSSMSLEAVTHVGHMIGRSSWIAAALFLMAPLLGQIDERLSISSRSYALFALFGVSWFIAGARYGDSKGLLQALGIALVIAASLSRTATAVALLLLVISRFNPRSIRGWLGSVLAGAIGLTAAYVAFTRVDAIRERFTEGDVSLQIAGVSINATGRTEIWERTMESYRESPWVGQGLGSASRVVEAQFPGLGHPHNDYLRILHDVGLVGLVIWFACQFVLVGLVARAWWKADKVRDVEARIHLTALLSLIAVSITMLTDNIVVYAFYMLPLGVIIGTSLGIQHTDTSRERNH